MARARNPNRETVKGIWIESGGKAKTKELAAAAGVPEARIRKWKSQDKWQLELEARLEAKKRGGQRGNRNAAGHGAPIGNTNAQTHGAYSQIHLDNLSPEEREYIENLTIDAEKTMLIELQILFAKERDLSRKIRECENASPEELFIDRVIEMLVPKTSKNENANANSKKPKSAGEMKIAMQNIIKASPFDRAMRLEAEYNKIHGRILKLIDAMRAHELDKKRLNLDERKHTIAKQRLTGVYSIDPDTGEIDDTPDAEDVSDE